MHLPINYVEFSSADFAKSRAFFEKAFDWTFINYGPSYAAMSNAGVDGGIDGDQTQGRKAPLIVLKADDLGAAEKAVKAAGGMITKPIFSFPGGKRFHFREPGGNELAVWSEK